MHTPILRRHTPPHPVCQHKPQIQLSSSALRAFLGNTFLNQQQQPLSQQLHRHLPWLLSRGLSVPPTAHHCHQHDDSNYRPARTGWPILQQKQLWNQIDDDDNDGYHLSEPQYVIVEGLMMGKRTIETPPPPLHHPVTAPRPPLWWSYAIAPLTLWTEMQAMNYCKQADHAILVTADHAQPVILAAVADPPLSRESIHNPPMPGRLEAPPSLHHYCQQLNSI